MNRFGARRLSVLGQGGLPVDIARAVTFLASDAAAGVNGQRRRVAGGKGRGPSAAYDALASSSP